MTTPFNDALRQLTADVAARAAELQAAAAHVDLGTLPALEAARSESSQVVREKAARLVDEIAARPDAPAS